jgi:hypothetical protein
MATPRPVVDETLVINLAKIHCTTAEIAIICKCSKDTLERHHMEALKQGRSEGKTSLRRAMWKSGVEKGNTGMLIFMAKNLLGMTDRPILDDQDITKYSKEEIERIATKALDYLKHLKGTDGQGAAKKDKGVKGE